jgi:hypothetical protein
MMAAPLRAATHCIAATDTRPGNITNLTILLSLAIDVMHIAMHVVSTTMNIP